MDDIANLGGEQTEQKNLAFTEKLRKQSKEYDQKKLDDAKKNSQHVIAVVSESMKRQNQIDRIEDKLDRILEILEKN